MPFIDEDNTIYYNDIPLIDGSMYSIPRTIMYTSNVVISNDFRILKNRFGPDTNNKYVKLARDFTKINFGEIKHFDDTLFVVD